MAGRHGAGGDDPGDTTGREFAALASVFEDLEQQAAGLHLVERDAELADRAHGEYAQVTLASRVHASSGRAVRLALRGGAVVEGIVEQVGDGWCRVVGAGHDWVVRLPAVTSAEGLSPRSVPEAVRPAAARLGLRSALRRLGEEAGTAVVVTVEGRSLLLHVERIGADFLEGGRVDSAAGGGQVVVPFGAVAALRPG